LAGITGKRIPVPDLNLADKAARALSISIWQMETDTLDFSGFNVNTLTCSLKTSQKTGVAYVYTQQPDDSLKLFLWLHRRSKQFLSYTKLKL